jgi:hypothetical protein
MKMNLVNKFYCERGIFGELFSEDGQHVCYTLQHAYQSGEGFLPKLPKGEYVCVRGQHQLASMDHPFETFEVTKVPGHSGILFHTGNFNQDSNGCILVGLGTDNQSKVLNSKDAFAKFMALQGGIDSFTLCVK